MVGTTARRGAAASCATTGRRRCRCWRCWSSPSSARRTTWRICAAAAATVSRCAGSSPATARWRWRWRFCSTTGWGCARSGCRDWARSTWAAGTSRWRRWPFSARAAAVNEADGLDGLAGGPLGHRLRRLRGDRPAQRARRPGGASALSSWGRRWPFSGSTSTRRSVFMGDAGALAWGRAWRRWRWLAGQMLLLIVIGLVFVAETASVMIQVAYFQVLPAASAYLQDDAPAPPFRAVRLDGGADGAALLAGGSRGRRPGPGAVFRLEARRRERDDWPGTTWTWQEVLNGKKRRSSAWGRARTWRWRAFWCAKGRR